MPFQVKKEPRHELVLQIFIFFFVFRWSNCDFLTTGRDNSSWTPGEKQSIRNGVDLVDILEQA